jgi:hypothetical protein
MTAGQDELERILSPAYLESIQDASLEQVRAKRAECQRVEVKLSYVRRLAQGRLDIVHAEMERRSGSQSEDLAELVEHLTDVLSDRVRAPGTGRLPQLLAPDVESGDVTAELDAIAGVGRLGDLRSLGDQDLSGIAEQLSQLETRVSASRRALHERIDALQDEIVGRYKSGRASVDNLLG